MKSCCWWLISSQRYPEAAYVECSAAASYTVEIRCGSDAPWVVHLCMQHTAEIRHMAPYLCLICDTESHIVSITQPTKENA